MARENTLHGMICSVPGRCGSTFITSGAKVIVVAYQTFVAPPTKIRIQTCVTAHTCKIYTAIITLFITIMQLIHRQIYKPLTKKKIFLVSGK